MVMYGGGDVLLLHMLLLIPKFSGRLCEGPPPVPCEPQGHKCAACQVAPLVGCFIKLHTVYATSKLSFDHPTQ